MKRLLLAFGLALWAPSAWAVDACTNMGNANYTALITDQRICTPPSLTAARTITLPSAGGTMVGQGPQGPQNITGGIYSLDILDMNGQITATNTITVTPASGETINGSTGSVVLNAAFSKLSLFPLTGTGWLGVVTTASGNNTQVFTASGTYTVPLGVSFVQVMGCAGGGGGGSGFGVASGTAAAGAGGGGGGDCRVVTYRASDLGTSQVFTIGAGGAGGASGGSNPGTVGGNTCFGGTAACGGTSLFTLFGGGGGGQGVTGAGTTGGGGGGGCTAAGSVGTTTGGAAGDGCASAGGTGVIGVAAIVGANGGAGGAGGVAAGAAGVVGGLATLTWAAPGGGSGGGVTTAPASTNGGAGGTSQNCKTAGVGGTAPGGAGGTATLTNNIAPGCGGGGGASGLLLANQGGTGGAGTNGGGGGGGGSACTSGGACTATAVGAGGAGGTGFLVISAW